MKIGVPKEIKNHEYRVGMTPAAVHELCGHGTVFALRRMLVLPSASRTMIM
jgi:alanine dehydrogenase